MQGKSHTNRRTYRGKGFKDGNLPSNLKGKKKKASKPTENKYEKDDADKDTTKHSPQKQSTDSKSTIDTTKKEETVIVNEEYQKIINEIKDVRRKIRNMQESIQLSVNIAQPLIWRDNCLNATLNIVNQWRSIVLYHGTLRYIESRLDVDSNADQALDDDGNLYSCIEHEQSNSSSLDDDSSISKDEKNDEFIEIRDMDYPLDLENELCKSTHTEVFGLIQMTMQVGPLKGSNAGYFKRCGKEVASMAKDFLVKCISSQQKTTTADESEDIQDVLISSEYQNVCMKELLFTLKQSEKIEKWMKDASKAVAANKTPSKSALKLQSSVNTKDMSRKDKRRKGKVK